MYVTVFLKEAKTHTVVPSDFIKDLVEVNLFNKGNNPNQCRVIFFSKKAFDLLESGEAINLLEFRPKFNLPRTNVYPPTSDEVCYIGRMIKFWCK